MPTMQEYLEEMARRQATGWTPGVPTRYTGALPTSYPAFSNLSALWAGSQPKANLGDIAAASADPAKKKGVGRPKLTAEEIQRSSTRAGTGVVKSIAPMMSAVSKVAGPAAIAYEALRSDPAVASELAPGVIPGDFRVTQAYPSMAVEEGYPNVSTLPSFDVTPDAGGAIGGVPGEQPMGKYGPSGYEGESIPPSGYRQIAPDSVIAASDFEVGPTSMAQVGDKPVISLPDVPVSQPSAPVGSPSWGFIEPFAGITGVDPTHFDRVDIIDKLASSGALNTPSTHTDDTYAAALKSSDLASSGVHPALVGALGLQGLFTANVPSTVGHFAGLVDSPHAGQAIDDSIEQNILGITTPDVTPNMWDTSAISTQSALDPNLQGTTPFSMANATGNLAGYGTSTPGMLEHQMGLNIDQPNTKYGDPYWDSDYSVQMLVDEDVAAEMDDFSEIAPVELDTYGKYKSDTDYHQGDWKGKSSADYANWQLERLPTFTTMTPTMERVREQEAVAAGNIASETAGGLDRIARERIANQAAIEQQMKDDAARMEQQRKDAQKALEDARILARKKENARLNAAKREMLQERRQEEAARQAAAQAEANAAIERVAQANAIMNSRDYQEGGIGNLSAAQRDVLAAANVDTFAGMGFGRGFMGADIGREDGGGFTGGDFSGGAGWE